MSENDQPQTGEGRELEAEELNEVTGGVRVDFVSGLQNLTQFRVANTDRIRSLLDGFSGPTVRPLPVLDRIGPRADDGIGKVGGGIGWKDTIIRW